MQTLIRPSAKIRQNYNEISALCKETKSPVFLTKNGEGDLVVMDIEAYNERERTLALREKLVEIEEKRLAGRPDFNLLISRSLRMNNEPVLSLQGYKRGIPCL